MSGPEGTNDMAEAVSVKQKRSILDTFRRNPVVLKKLRARMRGGRAFTLITIYLGLLSLLVSIVYFTFVAASNTPTGGEARQMLGKAIFAIVVSLELVMISFIAPALTSGAISSEREHQTYDLLRTTLLPARSLVFGKLTSAMSFILLLLLSAIPLQSLSAFFGGVAIEEVLIGFLILFVTALAYCAIGLFFSSLLKRTLASTVLSYASAILIVFGLPLIVTIILSLFGTLLGNVLGPPDPALEYILMAIGWVLVSINPLATAVATEVILINEQSLFYTNISLSGNAHFPFISPWMSYTVIYLLLSLVLIFLSVRFVRRAET